MLSIPSARPRLPLASAAVLALAATWIVTLTSDLGGVSGARALSDFAFEQDGSVFSHTISLLYPIGDVIVVTIVLYVVLRSRPSGLRSSAPILLIGGGLLGLAFSDSAFTYLTATNNHLSDSLIDIRWFCGYTLILLAVLHLGKIGELRDDLTNSKLQRIWLPYGGVFVALASSSFELVRTATSNRSCPGCGRG